MWISKIELTNFKSYQHAEFEFPEPSSGENIVLIGGMNGYGKTSILEALYLGLYGKDAIVHLARAGLKADDSKGYPTFLERAFNGEAKRDGQDSMSVRIVINKTKTKAIDIRRRWYFKSNSGIWTRDEEAVVWELTRGVPGTPKKDGKNGFLLPDLLDNQFVPAHIAPFFFFDGEEVKKLADQSRIEQVKQGLEGLLGVVLLRNLAERLKDFEASKRSSVASVDEDNIDRLLAALTADEARLDELRQDATTSTDRLRQLKADRESFIERMRSVGGGGGDIATVKDLVEEREGLRNAQREVQRALERILADKLPFHLMPKSILNDFRTQLQKEVTLADWQNECKTLQPKLAKFEKAFLEASTPEISPGLTDTQIAAIKGRIEAAWASLYHPPPSNCAEEVVHSYLHEGLRERALSFLDSLTVGQQDVHDLLAHQRNLTEQIDELGKKIARVEGIDRDGTFAELRNNLSTVSQQIDEVEAHIREDDREIFGLESTVNNTRSRYQQERKRRDDTSPVRQLVGKAERVRAVIDEVVPALFPLKVQALAAAMTKVYKQLAHKTQVSKIVIDNDGTTTILGKNGVEIMFDRSAGENQIFATALIAGLAEVSGVRAPMVVDTPLGRLDSKHRENIFGFWTGTSSRQVILLSQDKEIDPDFYERIHKHVCVTYLLEHIDVGDGIGRTTAKVGEYFGAAK
ncbi:DNA sulfur modification protein DndD [Rugamonas sp. FT82W]|uniref:DNA sulfur modification protein DndD n=1 Tax=Duganella vulcania TaxID=2692166 RepID=A0A845G3R7_9BURK|nr:DNA sulfur modification protein DndD [Duganella vulcania]MYM87696.1 DNA sulfur modification protein DndD [Duganella vulcania]